MQEALRPIGHLAEAYGIRKALEDYEGHPDISGSCRYYCTLRDKFTGCLYVHVGGQYGKFRLVADIDLQEFVCRRISYDEHFERVDEGLIDEASLECIDLADRAYLLLSDEFEHEAYENRELKEAMLEITECPWSELVELFRNFGTVHTHAFELLPAFESCDMPCFIADLEQRGLITAGGSFYQSVIRLSDRARELLGIDEAPALVDEADQILFLLEKCGALNVAGMQHGLGLTNSRTRTLLRRLMGEGKVVSVGRGRARRYELAKEAGEVKLGA